MNYRRRLIQIVTFLGGVYFFLEFILPANIGTFEPGRYHEQISNGFIAVGAMAVGLGLINLLSVHGARLIFKRGGWINSLALLTGLVVMFLVAGRDWLATSDNSAEANRLFMLRDFASAIVEDTAAGRKDVPSPEIRNLALQREAGNLLLKLEADIREAARTSHSFDEIGKARFEGLQERLLSDIAAAREFAGMLKTEGEPAAAELTVNKSLSSELGKLGVNRREHLGILHTYSFTGLSYRLLFDGLFVSLGSAMFALLGFYIASAAYRAFRIRSMESGLMLGAALLVMLGQIPFGIWIYEGFPEIRLWILEVPNAAAFRAIKIGASVAGLVMAFRMWLSVESESFAERK